MWSPLPNALLEARVFYSLRQWSAFAALGLGFHWAYRHGLDQWVVTLILGSLMAHPDTPPFKSPPPVD
jgi:hypothetical protein